MSLIGYARVSTAEGRQVLDRQLDALNEAGCERVFEDRASGAASDRPKLAACLDHLRQSDVLVVLDLDRLGRRAGELIALIDELDRRGVGFRALNSPMDTTTPAGRAFMQILVQDLNDRDIGIRVLAGQGASIDTTTPSGKLVFALFAALAEFERGLIRERTLAGLASARARGRKGGRPHALSKAQVRLAQAAMAQRDTKVSELCLETPWSRKSSQTDQEVSSSE